MIIESMLEHEHWVRILKDTAIQNAEREERLAQHASLSKWIKWVNEGPACGLRRQHQFSRCATGWVPTAKSSGEVSKVDETDEIDTVDGLSSEQLNDLREEHPRRLCPVEYTVRGGR